MVSRTLQHVVLLTGLLGLSGGCVTRTVSPAEAPPDFVALTLGQAAEQAHSELAMLAKLRGQGLEPLLPPPDPALSQNITIAWTGPASGALQQICLSVGYRYREIGKPGVQPLTVVVQGTNRPAYTLIEDIAWQVQPNARVQIDPITRTISLAGTTRQDG